MDSINQSFKSCGCPCFFIGAIGSFATASFIAGDVSNGFNADECLLLSPFADGMHKGNVRS